MQNSKYLVGQIADSKEFYLEKDLVKALLEKDVEYSLEEVREIINSYKERRI